MRVTIPLAAAAALLAFSAAAHDVRFYEFDQLQRKVLSLQEEVDRLRKEVAGSESITRFGDMQNEISRLTGELEELGYRISTLEKQLGLKLEDLEYRVIELEGGDGSSLYETTTDKGLQRQNEEAAGPAEQALAEQPAAETPPTEPLQETVAAPDDGLTDAQRGTVGKLGVLKENAPAPRAASDDASLYQEGMAAFEANRMDVARSAFETFVREYPDSWLIGAAYFRLGEVYSALGDDQTAAVRYAESHKSDPNGELAPENLLALASALRKLGNMKLACPTFREVGKRYANARDVVRRADMAARDAGCR